MQCSCNPEFSRGEGAGSVPKRDWPIDKKNREATISSYRYMYILILILILMLKLERPQVMLPRSEAPNDRYMYMYVAT